MVLPPPPQPPPSQAEGGLLGIGAFVIGLIGLVISIIPFIGIYAAPLTVLAIILGAIGLRRPEGRGFSIAGLSCGLIGSGIVICWLLVFRVADDAFNESKVRIAKVGVDRLVQDAYPQWQLAHDDKPCPDSLAELARYLGMNDHDLKDPWGTPYKIFCGAGHLPAGVSAGIAVVSLGEDRRENTADDIRSWERLRLR